MKSVVLIFEQGNFSFSYKKMIFDGEVSIVTSKLLVFFDNMFRIDYNPFNECSNRL